jgi:hypothetical protein
MNRLALFCLVLASAGLAGACSSPTTTEVTLEVQARETADKAAQATQNPAASQAMDTQAFLGALRSAGYPAVEAGPTIGSIFAGTGQIVKVNGADVQVFEYPDETAMQADAARISEDGGKYNGPDGPAFVEWASVPHMFKKGRLLVIYIGREPSVIKALQAVLGDQFAGG